MLEGVSVIVTLSPPAAMAVVASTSSVRRAVTVRVTLSPALPLTVVVYEQA